MHARLFHVVHLARAAQQRCSDVIWYYDQFILSVCFSTDGNATPSALTVTPYCPVHKEVFWHLGRLWGIRSAQKGLLIIFMRSFRSSKGWTCGWERPHCTTLRPPGRIRVSYGLGQIQQQPVPWLCFVPKENIQARLESGACHGVSVKEEKEEED